jgi:predicted nucleotidyltransferase
MGTIAPRMGSPDVDQSVGSALFGKTQRALLGLFFARPEQSFYLRQIVRLARVGQGAAQRELSSWVESGLLVRTRRGHQVHYQANRESPVFTELKALAVKTAGVADVLREALAPLADRIVLAFVHGSVAERMEKAGSDVDMIVVGEVTFGDVAAAMQSAQTTIGREVNPSVYSGKEFRKKLGANHPFLKRVVAKSKVFLIGGERELKQLGG